MDPASAGSIAARARTENFPVASLLFPRELRPHLRAVYGYAGSSTCSATRSRATGSPRSTSSSARSTAATRASRVAGDARASADDPRLRPPARAVPAPDRGEPDGPAHLRVRDVGRPEATTASTPPIRSAGSCSGCCGARTTRSCVEASDSVCTGLQLVNFLQDVPRDLELGRVYLPAEDRGRFGVTELDGPERAAARAARVRVGAGGGAARLRRELAAQLLGGRIGRAVELFARGGSPRSRRSSARTTTCSPGGRGRRGPGSRARPWRCSSGDDRRGRLRRGRADHAPPGAQLRVRDHGAAAAQAAGDRGDLRVRAPRRRLADGELPLGGEARAARELQAALDRDPGEDAMLVALADARARYPIPDGALHALVAGGLQDTEQGRYATSTSCTATAGRSRAPSGSRASPVYGVGTRSGARRRSGWRSS